MKNSLMSLNGKLVLRKRAVIETVNDELKNICQIEHSRHRSFFNFFNKLNSRNCCLLYIPQKKTQMSNIVFEKDNTLTIFSLLTSTSR